MIWNKKGLIYKPEGDSQWAKSGAMLPTPLIIDRNTIRVYLGFRDSEGIGRIGYVDVEADNPGKVLSVSKNPVLDIGVPGTFDDNGVLPSCLIEHDNRLYLYYIGFQLGTRVRYFIFSGLAESRDGGDSFQRICQVPILDRIEADLFFRTAPFVSFEKELYRMWYIGGSEWTLDEGKMVPVYKVRYTESAKYDSWRGPVATCWDFDSEEEHGFGRPFIDRYEGGYRMFYSIRLRSTGYRLGYAESDDGVAWVRKDSQVGIDVSRSGWDSEMICFSSIIKASEKTYMFYNGNNFGESGFGYAVLEDT